MAWTPPLIELHGATLVRGGRAVLEGLDFSIQPGEHIAILGPNGSGKSSLIRLLTRQDYPARREDGEPALRILGQDRWDIFELRSHLGIVSADLHLAFTDGHGFGRSLGLDVVLSGFFASLGLFQHQHVEPAMEIQARRALAQMKVEHLADRPMDRLSTGEARRILIARALAADPGALILDEPTTGLDLPSRHRFLETLRELVDLGKTLIMVTHHVEEILPEVDRVILLKQGRVFRDGSKEQILTDAHLTELFELPVALARAGGYYNAAVLGPGHKRQN